MSYVGDCVCCGKCCTADIFIPTVGLVRAKCENLVVGETIGKPYSTFCRIHSKIYVGMSIKMKFANGVGFESRCLSSYPRAQDAIPPECSYKWQGDNPQPKWSVGYTPKLGNLISEIY